MTKRLLAAALLGALAAALVPAPVSAHGAPTPREIDTRVLTDDDGGIAYGGCLEGCPPGAEPEGLDLLALDVREASLGGSPAIVFRIVLQSEAVHDGRAVRLQVMRGTEVSTFTADNGDGTAYASADFDRLDGPFDVGDGHPKAIDGWVLYSTLGAARGDELTGITVESRHHDAPDDAMPGTWYVEGREVPHAPHGTDPTEAAEEPAPGRYRLLGPAPLLDASLDAAVADLSNGTANLTLTVTNPLTALPQVANLTVAAPDGLQAILDTQSLVLEPGATRPVQVTLRAANATGHAHGQAGHAGGTGGNLTIQLRSDLGAARDLLVEYALPAVAPASGHDHDHTHGDDPKDTPGPALPLALAAVAALAWATRRRGE